MNQIQIRLQGVGAAVTALLCLGGMFVPVHSALAEGNETQTISYTVEDLGALPGDYASVAQGINASGQVVGWSNGSIPRAFLYTNGLGMTELPRPPGMMLSVAYDISDDGYIVGYGAEGQGSPEHALRWVNGIPQDLGVLSSSSAAWSVNSLGQVVGESPAFALTSHAILHTDAAGMTELAPGSMTSRAYDINDQGVVVGYFVTFNANHAFRWTSANGLKDIGADIFGYSYAFAVNASGQIAGTMSSASGQNVHLFRYTEGLGAVDLGFSNDAQLGAMNAQGQIVGTEFSFSRAKRAFIYTDEFGKQALNDLIDPASGWFLKSAADINDAGQIVGYGFNNLTGESHAVRLTPTAQVAVLAHVALSPVIVDGPSTVTGWVTLVLPAPSGGAVVLLSTDSPMVIDLPTNVVVSEGERNGQFELSTVIVGDTTRTMIEASYDGTLCSAALVINPTGNCLCTCHADPGGSCDGARTILDVVETINVAFRSQAAILDPNAACPYQTTDVNCTGFTDIIDVSRMINVAFRGANPATEFCDPCP